MPIPTLSSFTPFVTKHALALTYGSVVHAYVVGRGELHGYGGFAYARRSQQRHLVRFYCVVRSELVCQRCAVNDTTTIALSFGRNKKERINQIKL